MRFLVDAQLPIALARWLAAEGHEAVHVRDLGMDSAPDGEIWEYAVQNNLIIMTKDEDFAQRRAMVRRGPKIAWIRFRNCGKQETINRLGPLIPAISEAFEQGEIIVEMV